MQVSIENTGNLGRRVTVGVPKERLKAEESTKIAEYSKSVRLDGFRRGKVPIKLVKERFGPQIRHEVVGKLVESTLSEVLRQENLVPASQPIVEEIKDNKQDDLHYTFSVEVLPDIQIKDLSTLKLKKKTAEITEEDVNKGIERLQTQFGDWAEVQRSVKDGDKLSIDFEGFIDGKPFDRGSAKDVSLEVGSGQFIPGFEDGLVGAKIDKEMTLDLVFPEEYAAKDLAGKPVQFKVLVKKVFENKPAEVDEAFAKKIGLEDGDTTKVREKIKSNLAKFINDIVTRSLRDQALDALHESHPIDVPNSIVEKEKKVVLEDLQRRQITLSEEEVQTEAKKRAAIALLVNKIIEQNNLTPNPERIKEKIQELSALFGNQDFIQNMYTQSPELLQGIQHTVLADQATDFIIEQATIEEESSTFFEIADGSFQ